MSCPNLSASGTTIACALVPRRRFPAPGAPNAPCERCRGEWTAGAPPTAESLTPTLVELRLLPVYISTPQSAARPKPKRVAPPTIVELLGNFAGAIGRIARRGLRFVDASAYAARLEQCRGCPQWDEAGFAGLGRCRHRKCGCSRLKLLLATESCPIGNWSREKPTPKED